MKKLSNISSSGKSLTSSEIRIQGCREARRKIYYSLTSHTLLHYKFYA
uniref:Uncharacterized protein n=1 Tax=Rhizophora mucronata TaxID=61149 RepID=A0A2P2J424_RHIMU